MGDQAKLFWHFGTTAVLTASRILILETSLLRLASLLIFIQENTNKIPSGRGRGGAGRKKLELKLSLLYLVGYIVRSMVI